MIYVADTHGLVWAFKDEQKLGKKARKVFKKAEKFKGKIVVSVISLIECVKIAEKGELGSTFQDFYQRLVVHPGYEIYPLTGEIILKIASLTLLPDLHDRVIVATSLLTNATLITKDRRIQSSHLIKTIW